MTLEDIVSRHGGKRAYLHAVWWRVIASLGMLQTYRDVSVFGVERLVFVCKGNICRSPYAEIRAKALGLHAVSAGLEAASGRPADVDFSRVAESVGIDLSLHRSRNIADLGIGSRDMLIAFEPGQARALRSRFPGPPITLLGLFCFPVAPYIHDPYGAATTYKRACVTRIDQGVAELARQFATAERRMA